MARGPEAAVKRKVTAQLTSLGVYYFFPATAGYGRSGVPDIVACVPPAGLFVAIECKAGKGKPTALQELEMQRIRDAGGTAIVVNEANVADVGLLVEKLREASLASQG